MFFCQCIQVAHQLLAAGDAVFQKVFIFDDPHIFQCRSWARRAATKCGDIAEVTHWVGRIFKEAKHFFCSDG